MAKKPSKKKPQIEKDGLSKLYLRGQSNPEEYKRLWQLVQTADRLLSLTINEGVNGGSSSYADVVGAAKVLQTTTYRMKEYLDRQCHIIPWYELE